MKNLIILSLLGMFASGCTGHTQYGECVGLDENRDPKLEYRLSVWNVAMGIIFIETIIAPIIVIADEYECPVGVKK